MLWQFKYLNSAFLFVTDGLTISIIHTQTFPLYLTDSTVEKKNRKISFSSFMQIVFKKISLQLDYFLILSFSLFMKNIHTTSVVERELNVPLPISKIIKKWNNLLQEYKVSFFWLKWFSDYQHMEYYAKLEKRKKCLE